jgi:restriction endonuclease S subunit
MFKELSNTQNGFCCGCNSNLKYTKAFVQHRVAKSLGGTSDFDNLVVLCQNCHGYIPKSIRLPKYLFVRFQQWKEKNNIESSFSTIVRDLLSQAMDEGPSLYEENRKQQIEIKELLKEVDRLDGQIRQSSKALKAINRLSS